MKCYQEILLQNRLITGEAIKNKFLGKEYTLGKLMDYHSTNIKDSLAWGTMKNYFTTQKYIQMFLKAKLGTTDVYLSQLTYKFITDFEYFLRQYQPVDHHKSMAKHIESKIE